VKRGPNKRTSIDIPAGCKTLVFVGFDGCNARKEGTALVVRRTRPEYRPAAQSADVVRLRKAILDAWGKARKVRGVRFSVGDAMKAFLRGLREDGVSITRRTIYRWESRYFNQGLAGLADGRSPNPLKGRRRPGSGRWRAEL
jgi:hypothetical protein